ncbi:hypothetical protein B0H14DRAFT_3428402 [Mycena olivaceomarginata]|nr:hypothetical protein B0H14DRAFT_3428402 [Mycena olivaceomarginata]
MSEPPDASLAAETRKPDASASRSEIRMIRDSNGNIVSILNSEGTRLSWNKVAHQQMCQGGKWHGQGTDGEDIERKRLFSPKAEVRTGLLVFSGFPSEIVGDVPGFRTDQERCAHIRRFLQQREELTRAAGHRRMILQISLLDEFIARGRSEREKARAILQREQKEAQDRANYEACII